MTETAMTGEIEARLREACVDWDGLLLPDQAEPRSSVTCGELREAADALARLTAELARLSDPLAVHINMVRGAIAKPSIENIRHIYPEIAQGEFEARCALRAAEARALTAEAERDQLKIGNRVLDELVTEHCAKRLTAEASLAKAVEALEPFAQAIEDNDDDKAGDDAETWESPIAMCVTYGDFRRAAAIRARASGESP